MFEEISTRLSELSADLARASAKVAKAENALAVVAKLHEIIEALEPINGVMVIDPGGLVTIEVNDAEHESIWWCRFTFGAILTVDTTRWPTFEQIVRRWEVLTPSPRAGNPFVVSTWRSPGRLVPTEYNNR